MDWMMVSPIFGLVNELCTGIRAKVSTTPSSNDFSSNFRLLSIFGVVGEFAIPPFGQAGSYQGMSVRSLGACCGRSPRNFYVFRRKGAGPHYSIVTLASSGLPSLGGSLAVRKCRAKRIRSNAPSSCIGGSRSSSG